MYRPTKPLFQDRADAGRQLATQLKPYARQEDVIVLALPRGGVPVAYEVAHELKVPLDIFLVRKLGVPGHEELALGAIATGGTIVVNREVKQLVPDAERIIKQVAAREEREIERQERAYRGDRPHPEVRDRTVILIDDGLATGASMQAAVAALRAQEPKKIVVAVPVGASETCDLLRTKADEVVCAETPDAFYAVGLWYGNFSQTTDDEVRALLRAAEMGSAA